MVANIGQGGVDVHIATTFTLESVDGCVDVDVDVEVDVDVDHFHHQVGLALPLDPLPQRSRGVHPGTTQDADPGIFSILKIVIMLYYCNKNGVMA